MGSNPACPTNHLLRTPPEAADAAVAALHRALLGAASVTALLDAWCDARGFPPVVAERVDGPPEAPDAEVVALLGGDTPLRFRRVRLRGGARALVEAENWFRPDRLPPAMLAALDGTDAPFGRVVAPLGCRRHPLATGHGPAGGRFVLAHRAVLRRPDGMAVAVVRERFSRELLD